MKKDRTGEGCWSPKNAIKFDGQHRDADHAGKFKKMFEEHRGRIISGVEASQLRRMSELGLTRQLKKGYIFTMYAAEVVSRIERTEEWVDAIKEVGNSLKQQNRLFD